MNQGEMPVFWMHEQSGQMKEIIMGFLDDKVLTDEQMRTLRWYLIQWIEKGQFTISSGYKEKINKSTQTELKDYLKELLEWGIDPF